MLVSQLERERQRIIIQAESEEFIERLTAFVKKCRPYREGVRDARHEENHSI
jgi:hypothetical protein